MALPSSSRSGLGRPGASLRGFGRLVAGRVQASGTMDLPLVRQRFDLREPVGLLDQDQKLVQIPDLVLRLRPQLRQGGRRSLGLSIAFKVGLGVVLGRELRIERDCLAIDDEFGLPAGDLPEIGVDELAPGAVLVTYGGLLLLDIEGGKPALQAVARIPDRVG